VNVVCLGDIHLDAEVDGRSAGGIPIRVLDTYKSLEQVIDYCADNNVKQVLLTGDYYRTNRPSQKFKAMFHQFVRALIDLQIDVVILEGNHDKSKSDIGKSAVSEFKTLAIAGVTLVDKPELINFDDFDLACIPWQYDDSLPVFELIKPTICIAHATVWGTTQTPNWGDTELGMDFQIPLTYFLQFDYTVLGHIHKVSILNENPLVMYPGSAERHTFGEWDNMGFVHITEGGWQHIKYNLRPKYDLQDEIPRHLDPAGMYRLTTTVDFPKGKPEIFAIFDSVFSFTLREIRDRSARQLRVMPGIETMSPTNQLKAYFDTTNVDFSEVAELWQELTT